MPRPPKSSPSSPISPLLTERQVARILGVSVRTVQGWRLRGGGPRYYKLGRSVRYSRSDVEEFLRRQLRRSTSRSTVVGKHPS